jgi:hypothetical protein
MAWSSNKGTCLLVKNLQPTATKRDLEDAFRRHGLLKEIWLARWTPCFALVTFWERRDAEVAAREEDRAVIGAAATAGGKAVRVALARKRRNAYIL